jgi:hypothetical protein
LPKSDDRLTLYEVAVEFGDEWAGVVVEKDMLCHAYGGRSGTVERREVEHLVEQDAIRRLTFNLPDALRQRIQEALEEVLKRGGPFTKEQLTDQVEQVVAEATRDFGGPETAITAEYSGGGLLNVTVSVQPLLSQDFVTVGFDLADEP